MVSVIVPARNESLLIGRCITSILASDYPDFEVIAVDDRSTDGTGAILERLAAGDGRLTLIHGTDVPEGWFGKSWACTQGARAARGAVLLFTDADTWHGPELLGRAVGMLLAEGADVVSLLQRQEMTTFWERVLQPQFFVAGAAIIASKGRSVERVNALQDPDHAMANGQFILARREAYEAIGGHGAVRHHVVEDILLARKFAEAGKKRWIAIALEDMSTRMYTSLGHVVEGWSKNLFAGAGLLTRGSAKLAYAWMAVLSLLPLFWLLPVAGLAAGLVAGSPFLAAWGLAACAASVACFAVFLRINRAPAGYALLFPLGALGQLYIFMLTTVRGRRVHWKGRTYRHA